MKKVFFIFASMALVVGLNSCSSQDESSSSSNEAVNQPVAPYTKSLTLYSDDKTVSQQVDVKSNDPQVLEAYLQSTTFVLVKQEELKALIAQQQATQASDAADNVPALDGSVSSITLEVKTATPEGYGVYTKRNETNLRGAFWGYFHYLYFTNYWSVGRWIYFDIGGYKYIYPHFFEGHPYNGRYTYKYMAW
ncbi:MAG: hypothetical protein RL662_1757 [Bacteroidota bacterium]|jgi:hypothetical protein